MQVPVKRRRRLPLPLLAVLIVVFFFFLGLFAVSALAAANFSERQIIDRVATTLYPGSPCEGRTVVVRASMDELKAMTGWKAPTPEPGGAALQNNNDGTCRVYILDRLIDNPDQHDYCTVYAHEYGHLAGANHGEPRMEGGADEPCMAVWPDITANRARMLIRAKIGTMPGWHLSCSKDDGNLIVYCFYTRPVKGGRERWRGYSVEQVRYDEPAVIRFEGAGVDKR